MASLLRSMMVIGAITLQSPLYDHDKPAAAKPEPAALAGPAIPRADVAATPGPAAREALEILAGLDPETRARLLALAAAAVRSGAAGGQR